jgi:hypothetical protein
MFLATVASINPWRETIFLVAEAFLVEMYGRVSVHTMT